MRFIHTNFLAEDLKLENMFVVINNFKSENYLGLFNIRGFAVDDNDDDHGGDDDYNKHGDDDDNLGEINLIVVQSIVYIYSLLTIFSQH